MSIEWSFSEVLGVIEGFHYFVLETGESHESGDGFHEFRKFVLEFLGKQRDEFMMLCDRLRTLARADEFAGIDERLRTLTATDDVCWPSVAHVMFELGRILHPSEFEESYAKWSKMKEYQKAGGQKHVKSPDEICAIFEKWEADIKATGIAKKQRAMKKAKVPVSTYYKYRKLCRNSRKKP